MYSRKIGVCSYLLIGFWFHRLSATKSAQKAMLVNRVSDTRLILGLLLQWWYLGSLDYSIMICNSNAAYYNDWICCTILLGAMGKSAQLGLHVWLADAMEGPQQKKQDLNYIGVYAHQQKTLAYTKWGFLQLHRNFTGVSLAHWIMGDGYWHSKDSTIVLRTECFTFAEVSSIPLRKVYWLPHSI